MSTDPAHPTDRTGSSRLDTDLRQLRDTLSCLAFPALQGDVLVELVSNHAPARLVERVDTLPRARRFGSLDDLCADLGAAGTPGAAAQNTGLPPVTPSTVPET